MKNWQAILFILFLGFQNNNFAQTQILVYDSLENIPVSFAHVISQDTSFQGYTNIKGEIELPQGIEGFNISCLGYEIKSFNLNSNLDDFVVYLNQSSYTIEPLSIKSEKLDIYKEVERVRKKLKRDKSDKYVSTRTSFETIYKDRSVELGEVFCKDRFKACLGFDTTERSYSDYSFDQEMMFLNVDIDRLIKKVNLTEKRGFLHLFNNGEIKKKNTKLEIIKELDSLFIISYSRSNQSGYIKFNKYDYSLNEYRILDHEVDKAIYNSINNVVNVEIDTLILNYNFDKGFINNVSFYLSIDVQNIGKIKTSGYIEEFDFQNKKYSTNPNLSSIQYDAYLSDFSSCKPEVLPKKIFYDKIVKRKSLVKDDKLSVALLQKFGYAPKIKVWSTDSRLTELDFMVFDQNIDFGRSKSQRSDFHAYQVDWVFFEDECDEHKNFGKIASIWNSGEAVFISKTKFHSLLLANLTLDIYEIYRRQLVEELQSMEKTLLSKDIINIYFNKASKYVGEMNEKSNFGNRIDKIIHYNDYVKDNLGIDNIKMLGVYKNEEVQKSEYSEGDLLLAIGKADEAVVFYLDVLKHMQLDIASSKPIYENLIHAYSTLDNKIKMCEYFDKWNKISNGILLDTDHLKIVCK